MIAYLLFLIPLVLSVLAVKTNFYPLKAAVTLTCIALLIFFGGSEGKGLLVVVAFGFSVTGDFFLSHRGPKGKEKPFWFIYGIGLFLLAHVFYLGYVSQSASLTWIPLLSVLIPLLLYYTFRIRPHLDGLPMKIAVLLYLLISCFSLALVISYEGTLWTKICLISGIGLIVFSDACISEANFMDIEPFHGFILPTYYAAHMIITLGMVL
ncbi:MAG: lysoplasmalogenase family protein [Spirochaetales bacterium]|nr:lysoplasmalogenase family protein [Spirochaetales bacterium]